MTSQNETIEKNVSLEENVQTPIPSFIRGITLIIGGMLVIISGYAFYVLRYYGPYIPFLFTQNLPYVPIVYVILGAYLMGLGFKHLRGFFRLLTEEAKLALEQNEEEQREQVYEDAKNPVDETLAEKRP